MPYPAEHTVHPVIGVRRFRRGYRGERMIDGKLGNTTMSITAEIWLNRKDIRCKVKMVALYVRGDATTDGNADIGLPP